MIKTKYFVNEIYENIWKDRYEKNNEGFLGNTARVANFIAKNEKKYEYWSDKFEAIMQAGLFFPAGRTMSNCGIGDKLTLNNCFCYPSLIPDNMEGIFDAVKVGALTHKAGGGMGYNFSALSPRGTKTHNDAIASGPVSFMDVFNSETDTIQQGSRRGANMSILSVYHPDIEEFIYAKSKDSTKLQRFNLSVLVDDNFMNAVLDNKNIKLHFPIFDDYGNMLEEKDWEVSKEINAKQLWDKIIKLAYDNGEPGIFFYDNMNKNNPANYIENIICTNPCAEYLAGTIKNIDKPLDYGGACNLGSLLIHNFIDNPFTKEAKMDYDLLKEVIHIAVRMLDNIIDVNHFPLEIYENYQKSMRTIGLGITGYADACAMLGIKYTKSEKFAEELMRFITNETYKASALLAKEKGMFKFCDPIKHLNSLYCKNVLDEDTLNLIKQYGLRNAKLQAIAPTGTMSLTFGNNCSSGIEPIFSLSYDRKVKIGGQDDSDIKTIACEDYAYRVYRALGSPEDFKDIFETALEMSAMDHVKLLSVFSKYTDMSVSKTINVPTDYSFEDTKDIYMTCWKNGIKGCTIFRPNPLRQGILFTKDKEEVKKESSEVTSYYDDLEWGTIIEPWDELDGKKRLIKSGCGKFFLSLFYDQVDGRPFETFISKSGSGGCERNLQFISHLMSKCLRAGVPIESIIKTAKKIDSCPAYCIKTCKDGDTSKGTSCPSAIGWKLEEMYKQIKEEYSYDEEEYEDEPKPEETKKIKISKEEDEDFRTCPQCGTKIPKIGCVDCPTCGYHLWE